PLPTPSRCCSQASPMREAHPRPKNPARRHGHALCRLRLTRSVQKLFVNADADWFSESREIMGTEISVELWRYDKHFAQAAIAAVMAEMHRIDKPMSPYVETSELTLINREAST